MRIKYYLNLWKEFTRLNIETWAEYRMNFIIGIIAMFLSNFVSIVMYWTIFQNIVEINGWTFWQIVFLSGLAAISIGIWHAFLAGIAPWSFDKYLRKGGFDRLLVQPANPFLSLIANGLDYGGIGDLVAGIIITYYGATMSGIVFTLQNTLLLMSMVFGGAIIFFSATFFVCTLSFWVTRSDSLNEIIWSLMKFIDMPLSIYSPILTFFLTFIVPFGFINYYPAQLLLGKGETAAFGYLTPIIGIVVFMLAYKFWKIGVKNYSSTGS
ncbi:MAG: ABC-2 family transporter protein [Candidatus Aenigmatarchaeota archaeon]